MVSFVVAGLLLTSWTRRVLGQIVPDTSDSYISCPACDLSYSSDIASGSAANESFAIVTDFVSALSTRDPEKVAQVFCDDGILWGTVSQKARYTAEEIYSYFDYFAREENEVLSACPQVLNVGGSDLYKANVAVNNSGSCLRMSFTVNLKNDCIAYLYSSYFPNDPEDLRKVDLENEMPWGSTETGTLPDPDTALGDCKACNLTIRGDIPESDVDGVQGVMNAWVDGLLAQNSTAIADTYCTGSSFLWGTVSNMRRNTYDEIKSYFDWFATSRNFTEEIKSVCPTLSMIADTVFVEDRELRLGEQCLRMSYTIANEDGTYCIKGLSSSYFPEEPAGLVAADAKNLNPSPPSSPEVSPSPPSSPEVSPSPPSPAASAKEHLWLMTVAVSLLVFVF